MTKQIVILGNQLARLEKIVTTQAIKTDNVFKMMMSKPAVLKPSASKQTSYSATYWIAGGLILLALLFVGFLLFVGVVIAIIKKFRGAKNE